MHVKIRRSNLKRQRLWGFRRWMKSADGRKMLSRRRANGKKVLAVQKYK
jgi:large subunit ribosomal protein L34